MQGKSGSAMQCSRGLNNARQQGDGKCKAEWAELSKAAGGAVGQCKAAVDEQCKAAGGGLMQLNTMETVLTDRLNFKLGGRKSDEFPRYGSKHFIFHDF